MRLTASLMGVSLMRLKDMQRLKDKAEGHAVQGRSLVSGLTVHANLNCYRTVNSRFRAVFGLGVFTRKRR